MSSVSFKNVIYKMGLEIIYLIYMYKVNLASNNFQWLICPKTKPNQNLYMSKDDLTLNNQQGLICHKTKPN